MNTPHPYLNPQEHPTTALYRLLALLPASTARFSHNEAQLAEAICYQARRAHHLIGAGLAAMHPLLPAPGAPQLPGHAQLARIVIHLNHEANLSHAIGELYHTLLQDFYHQHPQLQSGINLNPDLSTLAAVDTNIDPASAEALTQHYDKHYYFPLGKLLQQLPGDITNQPHLTPEQNKMCQAVSQFAEQAAHTLGSGLETLEQLLKIAQNFAIAVPLPQTDSLVAYLQAEKEFMQECGLDYRDAARNIAPPRQASRAAL
jgi:hypothetical protein